MDPIEHSPSASISAPDANKGTIGGSVAKSILSETTLKPVKSVTLTEGNQVIENKTEPEVKVEDKKPEVKVDSEVKSKEDEDKKPEEVKAEDKKSEEKKTDKPEDEKVSERLANLLKQEKRIQVEKENAKKEIEAEKAKWTSEKKVHEEDIQKAAQIQKEVGELKDGGPGAILEFIEKHFNLGISELADYYIKGESAEYKQKRFEQKFNKEREEEKLKAEEAEKNKETEKEKQFINNFKNEIKTYLNSNNEVYKSIELFDAHDEVFNVIDEDWKINGSKPGHKVMDIPTAAKMVNDFFYERAKNQAKTLKLIAEEKAEAVKAEEKSKEVNSNETTLRANENPEQPIYSGVKKRTLTNTNTARISNPINSNKSREDRIQRAIAAASKR